MRLTLLIPAFACAALLLSPNAMATTYKTSQELVLAQEARWLSAIVTGDRPVIEAILSKNFKHITSNGELLDRTQEVASMKKEKFVMNATQQLVDIEGDTAVIHGLNTITQDGKVLARERFTDVFIKQNNEWKALSAQETAI